jgi:hypothetical protein
MVNVRSETEEMKGTESRQLLEGEESKNRMGRMLREPTVDDHAVIRVRL